MDLSVFQIIQAVIAAGMVGFTKTAVSGMGILIIPLMASIFPAKASVGVERDAQQFTDFFAVFLPDDG